MSCQASRIVSHLSVDEKVKPVFTLRDGIDLVLVSLLLSVLVAAWYILQNPGYFSVRRVQFHGQFPYLTASELREAVMHKLKGGFLTVDIGAIEQSLEHLPWVAKASVRRQWPDTLQVQIEQQQAVARWGHEGLLNLRGGLFVPAVTQLKAMTHLPVLYGSEGRERNLINHYQQVNTLMQPTGVHVYALVEDERQARRLLLSNGIQIVLGRTEIDASVSRFAQVFPKLMSMQTADIKVIDLRYTNGFSVTRQGITQGDEIKNKTL